MNKYFLSILFFLLFLNVNAQYILKFKNEKLNKSFEVKNGQECILAYQGYLNQTEIRKGIVTEITDTAIFIMNLTGLNKGEFYIKYENLMGIKRRKVGTVLLKSLVQTGVVVGSFFALRAIVKNDLTNWEAFGLSLGVGAATGIGMKLLFPDKIKHQLNSDWTISLVPEE